MIDKQGNDLSTDRVFMVAQGLLNGWVCAPKRLSKDEVQRAVNAQVFPSGTSAGWQVQEKADADPHQCSPGHCSEDEDRQHWLVLC